MGNLSPPPPPSPNDRWVKVWDVVGVLFVIGATGFLYAEGDSGLSFQSVAGAAFLPILGFFIVRFFLQYVLGNPAAFSAPLLKYFIIGVALLVLPLTIFVLPRQLPPEVLTPIGLALMASPLIAVCMLIYWAYRTQCASWKRSLGLED